MASLPRDTITHYEYDGKGNINIIMSELVRCKDCVHYSSHKDDYMCGINVLAYIHENDFCSRAERRTQ